MSTMTDSDDNPAGICTGWRQRIVADERFRRRVFYTLCIYWTNIATGWTTSLQGPTLPDISLIINKDLETTSWFLTAGSFGLVFGCPLGGFLYGRLNKTLLVVATTAVLAISTCVTPWCTSFPGIISIRVLWGLAYTPLITALNADIIRIWDAESGPYMQVFFFSYSLASILSPLVTASFLLESDCLIGSAMSIPEARTDSASYIEAPAPNITIQAYSVTFHNKSTFENKTTCEVDLGEMKVHFAYLIAAMLFFSATACFIILYFCTKSSESDVNANVLNDGMQIKIPFHEMQVRSRMIFFGLIGTFSMSVLALERLFCDYLMTFLLTSLSWNKSNAAYVLGVYWSCALGARLVAVVIVRWVKHSVLVSVAILLTISSVAGILLATVFQIDWLIWILSGTIGMGVAISFPCFLSWTSQNILRLSGRVVSFVYFSGFVGVMAVQPLAGFLMERYSSMWFVYLLWAVAGLAGASFGVMFVLGRVLLKSSVEQEHLENIQCLETHG